MAAVLHALLVCGLGVLAEEPSSAPQLTKVQRGERIELRNRLWRQSAQLRTEGKLPEAIDSAEEALKIQRELFGDTLAGSAKILEKIAELNEERRDFPALLQAWQELLAVKKDLLGEDHWQTTDARLYVGSLRRWLEMPADLRKDVTKAKRLDAEMMRLKRDGKMREAIEAAKSSVEIHRRLWGEEHHDTARSLGNLGVLYYSTREYALAEPLFQKALEIKEKVLGKEHPGTALALHNLGALHDARGEDPKAQPYFRQALDIRRRLLGEEHPDSVTSLIALGLLCKSLGDDETAEPHLKQALEIRRRLLGEDHPETAECLDNLGSLCTLAGRYAKAEKLHRQALVIRQKLLGEEHPDTSTTLNNLGFLYRSMGEYEKAESHLRQALEIKTRVLVKDHPDTAANLSNLGLLYQDMGDYPKAEPLLRQALEIDTRIYGEEHPETATNFNNLGLLYRAMGDYAKAETLLRRAVKIDTNVFGADHPHTAASLDNLGRLYCMLGDYAKAEPALRQALAAYRNVHGEEHLDTAISLQNLGVLYSSQGEYAKAEPLYRQALEIKRRVLGEDHLETVTSLHSLGHLYRSQGELSKAEPLLRRAVEIYTTAFGEEHIRTANSLNVLGGLYRLRRDYGKAEPLLRRSLEVSLKHLELTSAVQAERQQLAMAETLRYYLDSYLSLDQEGGRPRTAYRSVLSWKGSVLSRQQRQRLAARQPEAAQKYAEYQSVSGRLATLAFSAPKTDERDMWRRQLEELTEEKERLEAELSARSAEFRQLQSKVTVDQLQQSLPPKTALVDVLEYRHSFPLFEGYEATLFNRRYVAFVVRRERLTWVDLGSASAIEEAVDRWREGFGRLQTEEGDPPGRVLRRLVWEPVAEHLAGAEVVLVSPDADLARFPFAALPGRERGTYLVEEIALATVPVPQLLPALLRNQEEVSKGNSSLLLVGEVDYGAKPGSDEGRGLSRSAAGNERAAALRGFAELQNTGREAFNVRDSFESTFTDGSVRLLRRHLATEQAFRRFAPEHRYVHLATHGFFAPPSLKSALVAGPDERRSQPGLFDRMGVSGWHPGLLSGLALAGANLKPDPDRDDGILTAMEIAALDLSGVELATLSACETGLGQVAGGEGLLGLQRAFQVSGARTTVASLWKVHDSATRLFMERFYTNLWKKKLGGLEALREAQLWMLRDAAKLSAEGKLRGLESLPDEQPVSAGGRLPPYYWAAFTLSGDWR